ncbi:MAG: Adenylate/guanylate cyclase [Myxococcaceae bacterium]|nr:Adenylate/guanylate cyclase [Myxococcaceae bacterium]
MKSADEVPAANRLWELLERRRRPDADVAAIDARIWETFGETRTVMFTDLAGFSRMVAEFGIIHFLQEIHDQRSILLPVVLEHEGILVKEEADSMLLLFDHPAEAIKCAIEMQRRCQALNVGRAPENAVLLCIGLGYGRVLHIGDQDVFGQEVNAASKLGEDTAKANEILVTDAVRAAAGEIPDVRFEKIETSVAGSATNFRVVYTRVTPA